MGWRKNKEGALIGDAPLDILDGAFDAVSAAYKAAWKRPPTRQEWEALLTAAFAGMRASTVKDQAGEALQVEKVTLS